MPALDYILETLAGPVVNSGASGDVATDTGCTATLTAGRWLVLATASHVNLTGAGGVTQSSEVEVRHESTRLTVSRWSSPFGSFAPSIAGGTTLKTLYVLDALNGDEITVWLRRDNNGGADTGDVEVGDIQLLCVNLDTLVEGADYWWAEGPNSDTAEVTAAGTTWVDCAAAGQFGQGGSQVDFTAPSTGDYWVTGSLNAYVTTVSANTEIAGARMRRGDGTPANIGSGVEQQVTLEGGSPTASVYNFTEEDVLSLTAGDTPDIRWQVNNSSSGTSVGFRRSRLFVLRLDALTDYAFITNAGNIQTSGGSTTEGANGLTFSLGTDALVTASPISQPGGGNWGRSWLHEDAGDVHHPASAELDVYYNDGSGGSDDVGAMKMFYVASTGSQTFRLAQQADGGAGTFTLGRTRGNGGSARTVLLAMTLATPDSGDSHAGSGTLAGVGSLTGAAGLSMPVSGTLAGVGALTGAAGLSIPISGTLAGVGSLTGAVSLSVRGSGVLTGIGTLTGDATISEPGDAHVGSGTLAGVGSLTGAAGLSMPASGSVLGTGAMTGLGTLGLAVSGSLAGAGGLSGAAALSYAASGTIAGAGSLTGAATLSIASSGSLLGVGSIVASTTRAHVGSGSLLGAGALTGGVSIGLAASGSVLGQALVEGAATMVMAVTGSLSGIGRLTGNGTAGAVVPVLTSLSVESGHPTGGYLVEITGANFNLPPAPPATGRAPVPGPSVRVEFGGVASRRVAVVSSTRLLVVVPKHAMPTDSNGRTLGSHEVDVTVTNLDDVDGTDLGAATLEDGFTYVRPDVSGRAPSLLVELVKYIVTMLRGEVTAEVITHQSTDYDSDVSTLVVDAARLPQVILSGPQLEKNGVYTDNAGERVTLDDPLEFRVTRRPLYCDLKFDLILITNSDMHLFNLLSLITTVVDRNSKLEVPFAGGVMELPLDWSEGMSVTRQTSQLNSNIRAARGSITITGFPFVEIPGTSNDATADAGMQLSDVPSLQPPDEIGDNLPS